MAWNPAPCSLQSKALTGTESLYNPFEAAQASLLVLKQPPKRKGPLLIVTLFHASVAGVVAALGMFSAGCFALLIVKHLANDQALNELDAVSSFVVTLALATLAFLLFRAECRNFRPSWHREKKILAAWLTTTIPLILWTLRHLAPGRFSSILPSLSNAGLPVSITAIWLGSILTRAWLWRHQWHRE
jgi:hypothetical protein